MAKRKPITPTSQPADIEALTGDCHEYNTAVFDELVRVLAKDASNLCYFDPTMQRVRAKRGDTLVGVTNSVNFVHIPIDAYGNHPAGRVPMKIYCVYSSALATTIDSIIDHMEYNFNQALKLHQEDTRRKAEAEARPTVQPPVPKAPVKKAKRGAK